jgi:hypothetical protein
VLVFDQPGCEGLRRVDTVVEHLLIYLEPTRWREPEVSSTAKLPKTARSAVASVNVENDHQGASEHPAIAVVARTEPLSGPGAVECYEGLCDGWVGAWSSSR